jgi:putative ABC transport system ATP-binding protein
MISPILEARGLKKSFDKGRIEALRGIDLEIAAGDYVAITGPSGSGKSTLLQLLGGLDGPTEGEVLFAGKVLGKAVDLDVFRAREVGFIFQAFHLLPTLRAIENVQVAMMASAGSGDHRAQRARALLAEVGLESRLTHFPSELSAGERQRVAIARALANRPAILLADEPTGNLDSASSAHILEILTGLQQLRRLTLVMVTHDQQIASRARRHIRIHDGRMEA